MTQPLDLGDSGDEPDSVTICGVTVHEGDRLEVTGNGETIKGTVSDIKNDRFELATDGAGLDYIVVDPEKSRYPEVDIDVLDRA